MPKTLNTFGTEGHVPTKPLLEE